MVIQFVEDMHCLLWHGIDPWLRNFHIPGAQARKKKKKKELRFKGTGNHQSIH